MPLGIDIFGQRKALVGMVHVQPLPGTPRGLGGGGGGRIGPSVDEVVSRAVGEARLLAEAGFDALVIENMHDVPYLRREVGPEIVASMAMVGRAVREAVDVPLGVQVLAGANRAAVAVALACGAGFVRAEGFVYASVADEGLLDEADAGPLLRYRRMIGADHVRVIADIKKKHNSHAITADVDLAETARTAEFCGADGVIVTGVATGRATSLDDVKTVRAATKLPLAIGSGARPDNLRALYEYADAVIVGSWYKHRGDWMNPPDPARVKELVAAANRARL
ncbi:MAG: BtpA/SgcQ family protein [Phycisphaerales bacterium]